MLFEHVETTKDAHPEMHHTGMYAVPAMAQGGAKGVKAGYHRSGEILGMYKLPEASTPDADTDFPTTKAARAHLHRLPNPYNIRTWCRDQGGAEEESLFSAARGDHIHRPSKELVDKTFRHFCPVLETDEGVEGVIHHQQCMYMQHMLADEYPLVGKFPDEDSVFVAAGVDPNLH